MLFHRCSTFFSHTQWQPYHIRHNFFDMLPLLPIFLHVHVCLFFKLKNCQTFSVPSQLHPKHFQVKLFSAHKDAFYTHQQPCRPNNWQFTNLISIFKTQRKSSVSYLNILKSTAPGLTDFPLLLNHDLVYVSLFYSPLFCSIKYLAIVSIPTLIR